MANPQGAKGALAETLVAGYFNSFYPPGQEEEGLLWSRVRGKGSKDEGDVFGPYTAIEVKNYASKVPISSSLLANAERKAAFSKRRFWFLVPKPFGYGEKKLHMWPAITNVKSAIAMFGLPLTIEEIEDSVRDGTSVYGSIEGRTGEVTPFSLSGSYVFTKLFEKSQVEINESPEDHLSLVVFPRKAGAGETMDPESWFVVTNLDHVAWFMQREGILPRKSDWEV